MSKITVIDSETGMEVTLITELTSDSFGALTRSGVVGCEINNRSVHLTDGQWRLLVDGLLDLRNVLASVKATVNPIDVAQKPD